MLIIKTVKHHGSDKELVYVTDITDKLFLDGVLKHTFENWCKVMGITYPIERDREIDGELDVTTVQSIHIKTEVVHINIETKEFMDINEVPKDVKYVRAETRVETANDSKHADILVYVHVEGSTTTIYKPNYESKYFAHPRTLLNREEYAEKVESITLQV
ncbi:hypothetical protein ACQUY5_16620 [Bacillus cereus]|uniref:hypothetical protein n=1 Tax=Bacillus cereus TaxID=1396 RepID=UPI003D16DD27